MKTLLTTLLATMAALPAMAQVPQHVDACNNFAFDFFRATTATTATTDQRENALLSPLSMAMAMGMVANGTSPAATAELTAALGLNDLNIEQLNTHFQSLAKSLHEADPRTIEDIRAEFARQNLRINDADPRTKVLIANSIWVRNGFDVKPAFIEANRTYYDAEVQNRNFDLPATISEINRWCSSKTNGKIGSIIDQIPPLTKMYLLNALYFKARWVTTFQEYATKDADFTLANGTTTKVRMMRQQLRDTPISFYQGSGLKCVDLPMANEAFSMMVLMPTSKRVPLDKMIDKLNGKTYNQIVAGLQGQYVHLKLPRWKQDFEFSLVDAMQTLGARKIFVEGGLTGINDNPLLVVTDVRQKLAIEVNEDGTEAAAVSLIRTGLMTGAYAVVESLEPIEFFADRPFLYLIRERKTGTILFLGRIDNPHF